MRLSMLQGFGQGNSQEQSTISNEKTLHKDRFYWAKVSRGMINIENLDL